MPGTPTSPRPRPSSRSTSPGGLFSVAWSGDARASLLLTDDHNARRAYDGHGDRNLITACLGAGHDDEQTEQLLGLRSAVPSPRDGMAQ